MPSKLILSLCPTYRLNLEQSSVAGTARIRELMNNWEGVVTNNEVEMLKKKRDKCMLSIN